MSKSFKAGVVGLLLSAATAAGFTTAPAAGAVGGNLWCDISQSRMVICYLDASGQPNSAFTNINWYWNGVVVGHQYSMEHGCAAPGNEIVKVTYTQSGQNVTESISPGCNTGGSW
jgi:hypothetical protein